MTWNTSVVDAGPNGAGIAVAIFGDPVTDPQTGVASRPVTGYVPGYHLNTTPAVLAATPAAAPYQIVPATPQQTWDGAPTVFLKFPDKATAQSVLAAWWLADTGP